MDRRRPTFGRKPHEQTDSPYRGGNRSSQGYQRAARLTYSLSNQSSFRYFVTTGKGCEMPLCEEISELLEDLKLKGSPQAGAAGVSVEGGFKIGAALNLGLSCASRVLLTVGEGDVSTLQDVYELTRQLPWSEYFSVNTTFAVTANTSGEGFSNSMMAALKVKDALCDAFRDEVGVRPNVNADSPDVRIFVRVFSNRLTVSLDTSGESLSHRGYRLEAGEAPLREGLAASLLRMSGYAKLCRALEQEPAAPVYFERETEGELAKEGAAESGRRIPVKLPLSPYLFDPMAGSGTLLIEAALLLKRRSLLAHREHFAFFHLLPLHAEAIRTEFAAVSASLKARERDDETCQRLVARYAAAASIEQHTESAPLQGADDDGWVVRVAEENAKRAGVSGVVHFERKSLPQVKPHASVGLILTNPPYGERLNDPVGVLNLYSEMGSLFKHQFSGWTAWVISGNEEAVKCIGLRSTRKIPVFNGNIACKFFQYALYRS